MTKISSRYQITENFYKKYDTNSQVMHAEKRIKTDKLNKNNYLNLEMVLCTINFTLRKEPKAKASQLQAFTSGVQYIIPLYKKTSHF